MNTAKSIIATSVLAAAAQLAGCGSGEASVSDPEEIRATTPVPVQVAQPLREDIFATYSATATLSSDADAPVVARVAGDVVELLAEEGDYVREGEALARLDGERLRLEMLAARANLDRARSELARHRDLHSRGLISASTFDNLKFDLEALEASHELKKLEYDYATIRAPISGYVAAREIKPGQHVAASDVAFRITDTRELLAYLQIPQVELAKFAAGHSVRVRVASMPAAEFDATVARISPTIDARSGTFRATAVIDNSHGKLAPGMFGRFTIAYEKHADALVLPSHALINEDDESAVYVVNDGEVVRRVIETGVEADGKIEILAGLSEEDVVVVVGHSGLRDGSRVLASNALQENLTG
jgi:membrane fusion protein (multidrug efflux system)